MAKLRSDSSVKNYNNAYTGGNINASSGVAGIRAGGSPKGQSTHDRVVWTRPSGQKFATGRIQTDRRTGAKTRKVGATNVSTIFIGR